MAAAGAPQAQAQEDTGRFNVNYVNFVNTVLGGSDEGEPAVALSDHYIGVSVRGVDDTLRAQLGIPAGQGLIVDTVVEESPAQAAGLKVHDVLLAGNDKPLADVGDLTSLVGEVKDQPIRLLLVRQGKRVEIAVTPQRRPERQTGATCPRLSKLNDREYVRQLYLDLVGVVPADDVMDRFVEEASAEKRLRLANRLLLSRVRETRSCTSCHDAGPDKAQGTMEWVNALVPPNPELPQDVELRITWRRGVDPEIAVRRGDKTATASAKDTSQLDADVQPFVGWILGRNPPPGGGARGYWEYFLAASGPQDGQWRFVGVPSTFSVAPFDPGRNWTAFNTSTTSTTSKFAPADSTLDELARLRQEVQKLEERLRSLETLSKLSRQIEDLNGKLKALEKKQE